jgi:hypothetical protein
MMEEMMHEPSSIEGKATERIRTDALLRETSTNFIRLIGDADRKARIMLIVNSIFLTISATMFSKTLKDTPGIWISAIILMLSNMISLYLSIKSVQLEINNTDSGDTILHYKKCHQLPLSIYIDKINETMEDNEKKKEAIIKEMYYYGNLLTVKYRLLHLAYRIFSAGMVLTMVSYLVFFVAR